MAKAAIVVWSETAAQSEWVRAEADMARNQKKLIQTALGDIIPPLPFNQIQFADLGDWQGEDDHSGWRKVKASLSELCGDSAVSPKVTAASMVSAPPPSPPPPPSPEPDPVPQAASRWPLFAGIAIALIAIIGSAAFFSDAFSDGDSEPETPLAIAEPADEPVTKPIKPATRSIQQPQEAAPRTASASRGRVVGCYFWNSVYEYDGACRFVAGTGGDFTTFALDGPYFEEVVRIDLDVQSPGVGVIEMHYPNGEFVRVDVRRNSNDRACWDGPRLSFCAR